jgi:hypothetical protein
MKRQKEKAASKGCNPADGTDSETQSKERIMKTLPVVSARIKDWNGHAVDTLSWQVAAVAGSDRPGDLELQALCSGEQARQHLLDIPQPETLLPTALADRVALELQTES